MQCYILVSKYDVKCLFVNVYSCERISSRRGRQWSGGAGSVCILVTCALLSARLGASWSSTCRATPSSRTTTAMIRITAQTSLPTQKPYPQKTTATTKHGKTLRWLNQFNKDVSYLII